MKAIVCDAYGPPDVLKLADVATPPIGDGEVLVRVHAAGVDPGVWHLMAGRPYLIRVMGYGLRRPKQRFLGTDFAGRIEAIGAGVSGLGPGDEVLGCAEGTFAEQVSARHDKLVRKPAAVSFEHAAALPVSGLTALQGLRDAGRVAAGQKVLVIGAGGGIGTFAVQIARTFGAEVTGVCSASKADLVRALGATHIVDYTREDFTDGRRHYDVILDTAGNRPLARLRRALVPDGTLVIIGGEGGGPILGGVDRQLRALVLDRFVRHRLRPILARVRREDLQTLSDLLEAGTVAPVVDRTYPLAEAPEAIRQLARGHARGKTVITI